MGERNNGYIGCGRAGRGTGTCRQDGGCRRTGNGNDNDCGICRLFGCGNDARYGERYGERDGCGCSQSRADVNEREHRREDKGCGCSQQRAGVNTREIRRITNGCGCGAGSDARAVNSCVKSECNALMNKLQKLDFAIQETVLYLDAYPDCCEALALYRQLVEQRCAVAKEYERECGPLTGQGGKTEHYWDWVSTPWPWSPDFPGNGTGRKG